MPRLSLSSPHFFELALARIASLPPKKRVCRQGKARDTKNTESQSELQTALARFLQRLSLFPTREHLLSKPEMRTSNFLVGAIALLACCATFAGAKTIVAAGHIESQASSIRSNLHASAVNMSESQVTALLNAVSDMPSMANVWTQENLLSACSTANSPTGVLACTEEGYPTILSFDSGSTGPNKLSPWIGNLTELTTLSMQLVNSYNGTLPAAWSTLSKLTSLQIVGGRLQGGLPTEWSTMTKLTSLDLAFTVYLSSQKETPGPAPAWVSNLTTLKLKGANFGSNTDLPATWFTSSKMTTFWLQNVVFSGKIEPSLTSNKVLQTFYLYTRSWNGSTPGTGLSLSSINDLSGMTSLTSFSLLSTAHSGNIPTKWPAKIASIELASLSNVDGTIPTSIVSGSSLSSLALSSMPSIIGDIPVPTNPLKSNLATYQLVEISGLTGSIPSAVFAIPTLATLDFQYLTSIQPTAIAGVLPTNSKCGLQKLTIMNSQLSGSIPNELATICKNLTDVELSNNYLVGTIPSNWSALTTGLTSFRANFNRLTGSIPVFKWGPIERTAYTGLALELQANQLTGTIPPALISNNILSFAVTNNALDLCSNNATLGPVLQNAEIGDWECIVSPQAVYNVCTCADIWTNCQSFDGCSVPAAPSTPAPLEAFPPYVTSGPLSPVYTASPDKTPTSGTSAKTAWFAASPLVGGLLLVLLL